MLKYAGLTHLEVDKQRQLFCITGFFGIFGVLGLLFMYGILSSGGEWFLGVSKEDAPAAASACLVAAGVYGIYLVFCGMKLMKPAPTKTKISDEE